MNFWDSTQGGERYVKNSRNLHRGSLKSDWILSFTCIARDSKRSGKELPEKDSWGAVELPSTRAHTALEDIWVMTCQRGKKDLAEHLGHSGETPESLALVG